MRGSLTLIVALIGCASVGLAACAMDPYKIVDRPDSGEEGDGGGTGNGDGTTGDGGGAVADGAKGDSCVPQPEECNELDDDCNGEIDDVAANRLADDVNNCGACGEVCLFLNAFPQCVEGKCELDRCAPGYHDANKDASDGCEYQCLETNAGEEECPADQPNCACDNVDNDCDGEVDEVFDTETDVNNCGGCGVRCLYNHAAGSCVAGQCEMGDCEPQYKDLNSDDKDGCEYGCPVWPTEQESCNGLDDDCDQQIDEGLPGTGQPCDTGLLGACSEGVTQCNAGSSLVCIAQVVATIEKCDTLDNDCDGEVDEDYDLNSNPAHCGSCNNICIYSHASPKCVAGQCAMGGCEPGWSNLNGQPGDGCEHKCAVYPPSIEKCNGLDDDCDGQVDEGFSLSSDINNCGSCGTVCSYPHAAASCSGTCNMGACDANYYNNNGIRSDGCEYFCVPSGGEVCDNVDNDCNGLVDDGISLSSDANNCGACGNVCVFSNAAASCSGGNCVMGACDIGYEDADGLSATGCEYECTKIATDDVTCDGVDDDCDNVLDEDYVPTDCGTDEGACEKGSELCIGGATFCQGGISPVPETCNGIDDNCDSAIDDGFLINDDPRYCGGSPGPGVACAACSLPNAIAKCEGGQCKVAACNEGWVDLESGPGNEGCEYACTYTGTEICDGLDNDCDGQLDKTASGASLSPPSPNPCLNVGACAETPRVEPSCQGSYGWVCQYGPDVELVKCSSDAECSGFVPCNIALGVCPGLVIFQETLCDGKDNDCDNLPDDSFTDKGTLCSDTDTGECQGTGEHKCKADRTGTECVIDTKGSASNELCDGKDNDCDGLIDENTDYDLGNAYLGVRDTLIGPLTKGGGTYYYIYAYEASRPDADGSNGGVSTGRACSKAGVLPWGQVTYAGAAAACSAAGMRLCTAEEWVLACAGSGGQTYPYGTTYQPLRCNGVDGGAGDVRPTGNVYAAGTCQGNSSGLYDMSGNVREWTSERVYDDPNPLNPDIYVVRGGAYHTPQRGLSCQFDFSHALDNVVLPSIGFRCCKD